MRHRPLLRPRLEGLETRLAPSSMQVSTPGLLPYIEQENIYKQVPGVTGRAEGWAGVGATAGIFDDPFFFDVAS